MITREEYDAIDAVNYSTLSKLHRDPQLLLAPPSVEPLERGQLMGSLIDCIMFSPNEFDNKFFTSSAKLPAEKMNDLLMAYLNITGELYYPINEDAVMEARKQVEYGMNFSKQVILDRFSAACEVFLTEKYQAGDRIVVDQILVRLAQDISSRSLTNPFVLNKIRPDNAKCIGNQVGIVFYADIDGQAVKCKSLLDNLVLLEKQDKIIAIINDGKYASKGVKDFQSDFLYWNYHLQLAMYISAVSALLTTNSVECYNTDIMEYVNSIRERLTNSNSMQIEFNFIVYSDNVNPYIYSGNSNILRLGILGGRLDSGIIKKGIVQLIKELQWHRQTGYYEYPKDVYDLEGVVNLDINFTTL